MIKRLIVRLLAGTILTFAPVAEAEITGATPTIQDVLDTCADQGAAAQAACAAYVNATIQTADIMSAAANGGKPSHLFCIGSGVRPQDLVAVIKIELTAHPDRKSFPAPTAIVGGAVEAYPCAKTAAAAGPAAPTHRPAPHRRHR